MTLTTFLAASLLACAGAGATRITPEHVAKVPAHWTASRDRPDPNAAFSFSIALAQPEIHRLSSLMTTGTKPLSIDEIDALRAPRRSDVDSVLQWLSSNGIKDASAEHDWIKVKTTVGQAKSLLDADLRSYIFKDTVARVRATNYTIPEHLSEAISFIHPIANFMAPVRERAALHHRRSAAGHHPHGAANVDICTKEVNPSCIKKTYNVNYKPATNSSEVRFGVTGYYGEYVNHDDTKAFLKAQAPDLAAAGYDFKVEKVNGGHDPETQGTAGGEAQLDIEYAAGLGYPSKLIYYSVGGLGPEIGPDGEPTKGDNEPFVELINYLLAKPDDEVPHVLSNSYSDDEAGVPIKYAKRVCNLYGLLSKRGTTVIHGSGDGGSTGAQPSDCRTRDANHNKTLVPTFPASCPWVTSVGGTNFGEDPASGIYFSSGGFSNYFPAPDWQKKAVKTYVDGLGNVLEGYYNASNRAVPDISAVADGFSVIVNGKSGSIGGTSASGPVIASLIALINDARLRLGKPSLGFLNQALYSSQVVSVLQDITNGTSDACDFAPTGWPAAVGWDAITGLGAPKDFAKLLDALVAV